MAVGMGGVMLFQVFVPLLLVATASSSEKSVFGLTGGSIVLQAEPVTEKVTSIIWKHEKDKAAEWFEGDDVPLIFDKFTPVATLNTQTWALHISKLQTGFNGKYSAEVNNKDPTQFLTLTVLGPVSKPEITMDCIDTEINCTLTCEGKKDGFTTYTWADDIDEWSGSKLTVKRRDHDVVYTCNFSNPVSSASSPGTVKKYLPPPPPPPGPAPIIAGILVGIIPVVFIVGVQLVLKKQKKGWNDLKTSQGRADIWRSFIHRNNGAGENPANSTQLLENGETGAGENPANNQTPLLGNGETEHKEHEGGEENPGDEEKQQLPNTERKEPDGIEDSPGMPNPEDKRQPETDTDPLHEGKLTANAPGSTAEEEDKEQPEANTDPLHGEKLAEPFVAPTADGEPNEHDGGEEEQQLPNNEVMKQTEANTGPLHEGELTGNGAGPTADGENNEAHGGKESPEKTNTEPTSEDVRL